MPTTVHPELLIVGVLKLLWVPAAVTDSALAMDALAAMAVTAVPDPVLLALSARS